MILCLMGAGLYLVSTARAELRVWSDKSGSSTIEAQFIDMSGKKVILEKPDGKRIMVPKAALCDKDQEYLAGVIIPDLKINVDKDADSRKLSEGWSYTYKENTYTLNISIKKMNKDKCTRKFKAYAYLIAKSAQDSSRKVMGSKDYSFDFESNNSASFDITSSVKVEDWYGGKEGWEYEGYLVVVEDDHGKALKMDSSKSSYESSLSLIKKNRGGNSFRM